MDYGNEDLARLERMAAEREIHLLAFVDCPDPMALASTDTWHLHVFPSLAREMDWIYDAELDGILSDDAEWDMRCSPEPSEVLEDPGPIRDVTFHV